MTLYLKMEIGANYIKRNQQSTQTQKGAIFIPKIKANNKHKEKENKKMAVIIKLNGVTIGATTMTPNEIRNAENAGFTILRNRKENK